MYNSWVSELVLLHRTNILITTTQLNVLQTVIQSLCSYNVSVICSTRTQSYMEFVVPIANNHWQRYSLSGDLYISLRRYLGLGDRQNRSVFPWIYGQCFSWNKNTILETCDTKTFGYCYQNQNSLIKHLRY